ncbi:hypothetical protein JXA59_00145 [Patescibacteria group bacterium]|nr:hypothetical protein [Patescibacteria group bacterium]
MRMFQQVSSVVIASVATVAQAGLALAQITAPSVGQVPAGTNIKDILIKVGNWLLTIAGALAVVYLIYGGIMYIVGGEKGAEKAKTMIINAITGLVIIALASLIARLVVKTLGA